MSRFQISETITTEHIQELLEKFLDLRQSGEERSTGEGRLRSRGGVDNDILRALSMNQLTFFDVDENVEMLQKIGSEERN